jgi:hypothetical protein
LQSPLDFPNYARPEPASLDPLHVRTIDLKMMLGDFIAVEPSGKIAMRVLSRGPVASGFFWNAAQSEVICFDDNNIGAAAIRRSLREPLKASEHARPTLCHYNQTNSETLLRPN